jgi:hypothetical protein
MSLPEAIAEVLGGSKVLKTAIRTMDDLNLQGQALRFTRVFLQTH